MTELDAINAVADRLGSLSLANGFHSDAGQRVYRLRDQFTGLDDPPWLGVVFEGRDVPDGATRMVGCNSVSVQLRLIIVGAVELDPSGAPDRALHLVDDIDRVLLGASAVAIFAPLGLTLMPGSVEIFPEQEGDATTEVQVSVTAEFTKSLN